MSQQAESFNLDRSLSIQNNVDATGKKWHIKRSSRESTLLVAVPEPFRADAIIPKEMQGQWTSNDRLQEKITLYLNRSWDASEAQAQRNARHNAVAKVITPEESLDALPDEIKDVLAEVIAVEEPKVEEKRIVESKSRVKRVKAQSATKTGG